MSPAAAIEPTKKTLPESLSSAESSPDRIDLESHRRFRDLRGVQWRIDLGILPASPSSSVDDLRRVTADSRRSYATLRRRLLIDPHIPKDGSNFPDLVMDNPLSQNPDSMWGRFFHKAELEKMVDQDLSRLYPEHGSYFQTPGCQGVLRRILLLWCISHPNYGYRQGMHELLAPLLYVLQGDVKRLSEVRTSYEDYFTDNFDGLCFHETDSTYKSNLKKVSQHIEDGVGIQDDQVKVNNLNELDPKIQTVISFCDAYGAEGELGIVLSEKFMEHDAYCMFDALMDGAGGAVAMANFFSASPLSGQQNGLPPVIEASSAVYHLLSIVDSSLYSHLVELGVEPQYFALRWLRVLFGREFALEDLLVIWDKIFAFDNNKLKTVTENDYEFSFGVLNSSRGAFISALAVSMILYIRSLVLATENATSCLQRLLNFPEDVNVEKLIKKAKSLVPLAIDAINSTPHPIQSGESYSPSKSAVVRSHSLSSDAVVAGSPLNLVRESYWEEKWRVLHKEQEQKKESSPKQVHNRIKDWSDKVKSRLSRTESDPSPSKANREKMGTNRLPVRRNLLDDLAHQLGSEEEEEKVEVEDDCKLSSGNSGSEENSPIFSDPPSPRGFDNDNDNNNNNNVHENDTERSSLASDFSVSENDPESCSTTIEEAASPSPVLDALQNEDGAATRGPNLKDRKLLLGRFQWLWKFGKNGGEGLSEKGGCTSEDTSYSIIERDQKSTAVSSSTDGASKPAVDKNITRSLKDLSQSMLENIQVIESIFQQDKAQTGAVENLSKNAQITAMAALKELRKISNLLSET